MSLRRAVKAHGFKADMLFCLPDDMVCEALNKQVHATGLEKGSAWEDAYQGCPKQRLRGCKETRMKRLFGGEHNDTLVDKVED